MRLTLPAVAFATCSAACFLNAVSEQEGASGGGGAGADAPVGGNGAGGDASGGADEGGAGGSGGSVLRGCGNGIVELPEECEEASPSQSDTCVECVLIHDCANATLEPTEECIGETKECSGCSIIGGTCDDADELLAHDVEPASIVDGKEPIATLSSEIACNGVNDAAPTNHYRFDVGPYPRGLAVSARGLDSMAPIVFATLGCGDQIIGCRVSQAKTSMVTDVLDPGMIGFLGIGTNTPGGVQYEWEARFHRHYEPFRSSPQSTWLLGEGWIWSEKLDLIQIDAQGETGLSNALSPLIMVGGLPSVDIVIRYVLDPPECIGHVIADVDGEVVEVAPLAPIAESTDLTASLDLSGQTKIRIGARFDADAGSQCRLEVTDIAALEPL